MPKVVKTLPNQMFQVYSIAYIFHNDALKHSLVVYTHRFLLVIHREITNVNSIRDFVLLLIGVVPLLQDPNHMFQQ